MKRFLFSLLVLTVTATAVRAHFVWLLPSAPDKEKPAVKVVFSDKLAPDDPKYLEKIKQTELYVRGTDGKAEALKMTQGKEAWEAEVPGKGVQVVGAVCRYGVTQRGDNEPFLLNYYAKTLVISSFRDLTPEALKGVKDATWDKLALEFVAGEGGNMRVIWQGKPLADAEVVMITDGGDGQVELKTDKKGEFALDPEQLAKLKPKEMIGFRAKHTEAREGELDGKKYKEIRTYTTLTIRGPFAGPAPVKSPEQTKKDANSEGDPTATKLLAEARAARAQYVHFPGFTADIEINLDGKVHKGKVEVANTGKVTVEVPDGDKDAEAWARGQLGQTIGHRLDDSASLNTPCGFADEDEHHPLGRAVKVLNDEFHSSYRIRDKQIIVVNRGMKDSRFTITVMQNYTTEEGKFIPATYVVNTWDLKTDALKSSQTHHHTWKRVGKFDLPETLTVVTATDGKLEAKGLKLSQFALTK